MTTILNPNLSIVLPGACQCNCSFCFYKERKGNFNLDRLKNILNTLPEQFQQISITGGEPTFSLYLKPVLDIIDKTKFKKVVLTTNGLNLGAAIPLLEDKVDFVNISRHACPEDANELIFKREMPTRQELKDYCQKLNMLGIEVTLSCVLTDIFSKNYDILQYIDCAKFVGASQVFFRKQHGDIGPHKLEKLFSEYKGIESKCPVCRSYTQYISGMKTVWKCSVAEPSEELSQIYELIYHEDGLLSSDWQGTKKNLIDPISLYLLGQQNKTQQNDPNTRSHSIMGSCGKTVSLRSCN